MADKIEYWDADTLSVKSTEDTYTDAPGFLSDLVWVHEPSGLLVRDIAAFEKWIRQVRTP